MQTLTHRVRVFAATAVITVAMWPAMSAHAEGQDKSVIGRWRLTKVLDSSDITALDDDQAQKLVGQVFIIQADKVQLGKRVCDSPDFDVTVAETNAFFARYAHASAEHLGLPNPVTVVDVDCTSVYKKSPDKLVVHWQGFFFDAVRQK